MNKCLFVGRLTKDPDVRMTQNEKIVCRFTVAVDRQYKKGEQREADFVPCVAFGKRAEVIGDYFAKGSRIALDTRVNINNTKKDDGSWQTYVNFIVDDFEFIDKANKSEAQQPQQSPMNAFGSEERDEDIPF